MSAALTFRTANLPAPAALAQSLRKLEMEVGPTGTAIIKCDKTGHWVFGADQTEITDDSTWAINPLSFVHGYIAWGDGEVLSEKMVPVHEPLPDIGEAPPTAKRGWETQLGMQMRCMTGEDKGLEARYMTTSVGGKKALQEIAIAIADQVEKDQAKPVPVVELSSEHYQHKSYGRIYTPKFTVRDWVGMNGEESPLAEVEEAPVEAVEPEKAEEPARRRRRAV